MPPGNGEILKQHRLLHGIAEVEMEDQRGNHAEHGESQRHEPRLEADKQQQTAAQFERHRARIDHGRKRQALGFYIGNGPRGGRRLADAGKNEKNAQKHATDGGRHAERATHGLSSPKVLTRKTLCAPGANTSGPTVTELSSKRHKPFPAHRPHAHRDAPSAKTGIRHGLFLPSPNIVMTRLVRAIHVLYDREKKKMDDPHEAGHDGFL